MLNEIPINKLSVQSNHIWYSQWLLLTSGDFKSGDYNAMTVAWGSFGCMWNKPFAQVVVRHSRYTFEFMEKYDEFTLTVFPRDYRKALNLLGSRSGRDGDKISESGLTPIASRVVQAPGFEEAELIFECKKIYWDDMEPANFIDPTIDKNYPDKDYHRIYFGEIVFIQGIDQYRAQQ